MRRKVWIVILNWNSAKDTAECIDSLRSSTYRNFYILVVDNGSSDSSYEELKKLSYQGFIIKNTRNLGYTGGNNIGIRHAMEHGAEYVWLLNNDTVVHPKCLEQLIIAGEKLPEAGLLSPVVYYAEEKAKVQFAKEYIDLRRMEKSSGYDIAKEDSINHIIHLPGTALMIKRAVIEKIGFLRDELFAYWEDTDYCIRAVKANFKNVVVESAAVFHKHQLCGEDGSWKSSHFYYYMLRNKILIGRYHFDNRLERIRYFFYCILKAADISSSLRPDYAQSYIKGLWHGLAGVTGPIRDGRPVPVILVIVMRLLQKMYPKVISDILYGHINPHLNRVKNLLKMSKADISKRTMRRE